MRRVRGARGPRRPSAAGFTLIEVLLATVLLAAGLALAFATLRASTVTVERGEGLAARSDRMRAVEGFLRRRLAAAQPLAFALDPGSGQPLRFVGERDRMRFVADLPNYLGRGGPHLHDISVADDGDGLRLQVAFAMVLGGETVSDPDARPPEPLAAGLREVRFRYRGLDAENRFTEWSGQWDSVEQLPLQVSVEVIPEAGAPWPPMVVALPQGVTEVGPRRAMPSLDAADFDARRNPRRALPTLDPGQSDAPRNPRRALPSLDPGQSDAPRKPGKGR